LTGKASEVLDELKTLDKLELQRIGPEDIPRFHSDCWFNCNIINSFFDVLAAASIIPNVMVLDSFFPVKLVRDGHLGYEKNGLLCDKWSANLKMTLNSPTQRKTLMLVPFHDDPRNHWVLISFCLETFVVTVFDSLGTRRPSPACSLFLEKMSVWIAEGNQKSSPRWTTKMHFGCRQQENGSDCGVFVCWAAAHLVLSRKCPVDLNTGRTAADEQRFLVLGTIFHHVRGLQEDIQASTSDSDPEGILECQAYNMSEMSDQCSISEDHEPDSGEVSDIVRQALDDGPGMDSLIVDADLMECSRKAQLDEETVGEHAEDCMNEITTASFLHSGCEALTLGTENSLQATATCLVERSHGSWTRKRTPIAQWLKDDGSVSLMHISTILAVAMPKFTRLSTDGHQRYSAPQKLLDSGKLGLSGTSADVSAPTQETPCVNQASAVQDSERCSAGRRSKKNGLWSVKLRPGGVYLMYMPDSEIFREDLPVLDVPDLLDRQDTAGFKAVILQAQCVYTRVMGKSSGKSTGMSELESSAWNGEIMGRGLDCRQCQFRSKTVEIKPWYVVSELEVSRIDDTFLDATIVFMRDWQRNDNRLSEWGTTAFLASSKFKTNKALADAKYGRILQPSVVDGVYV
jgi:hypothetical protein